MIDILLPSGNFDSLNPVLENQGRSDVIKIIGVGGGGCNVVGRMIAAGISDVEFIVVNTDVQALRVSPAPTKIQIGERESRGLGVGGNPERGRKSAEENIDGLRDAVKGAELIFVATGMGGGTGTGAAPIVAQIAREEGILTIGVVTKPFVFEGEVRMQQAEEGIKTITKYTDTLIVIPNAKVIPVINESMRLPDLYHIIDAVLIQSVQAITDTITKKGEINMDLEDIKSILKDAGTALIGIGESSSISVKEAVEKALSSPLLDNYDISKANKMLINLTTNRNAPARVIDELNALIPGFKMKKGHIFFGHAYDERIEEKLKVAIVATGFNSPRRISAEIKTKIVDTAQSLKSESSASSQSELFAKNDNPPFIDINEKADFFSKPAYENWKVKKLNK
ncbi:MAG: cell division protein FtsZ [Elusimicrobiota bacterium]|jgi:cell division protein FtsZ|nr:cell division protein FtsZ [Elusimicrobiota bacterium]